MAKPAPVPFVLPPGILKSEGGIASTGRYVDARNVRFYDARPQKVGGNVPFTIERFIGKARGMWSWNDLRSRSNVAVGTTRALYTVTQENRLNDITPALRVADLNGAFTTVAGSKTVIVRDPAHGAVPMQGVTFTNLDNVGQGLIGAVAGKKVYVAKVLDNDRWQFDLPEPAPANATNAGAATATYDIKPGTENPGVGLGFGVGYYGLGTFGTARGSDGTFDPATGQPGAGAIGGLFNNPAALIEPYYWSLANIGKLLIAAPFQGKLYTWDSQAIPAQPRAQPVAKKGDYGPPAAMRGLFTTPEGFVICYGIATKADNTVDPDGEKIDPLAFAWPNQLTVDGWDPLPDDETGYTPTTGANRLAEGKKIVHGAALGNQVSLLWTDTGVHLLQYTGGTYTFSLRLIGTQCGLSGPYAAIVLAGRALWFGYDAFWLYAGGGAQRLPGQDDILEWVLKRQRPYFDSKVVGFYLPQFDEAWWIFVDTTGTEPSFYVATNLSKGHWTCGEFAEPRTAHARLDGGWNHKPLLATDKGWVRAHETGLDDTDDDNKAVPLDWRLETAPTEIQDGAVDVQVWGYMPDMARHVGDILLELRSKDRVPDPTFEEVETVTVPPETGVIDLHMAGRLMARVISQTGVLGGDFRLGADKFEISTGGKRR